MDLDNFMAEELNQKGSNLNSSKGRISSLGSLNLSKKIQEN